jgi:transcriptional regulator with XRE-family HTH domain
MRKLRLARLLAGKTLGQVARDVHLPAYVISAIERGEVAPPERWVRRFVEAYGEEVAADLLAPVEPLEALGPAAGARLLGSREPVACDE